MSNPVEYDKLGRMKYNPDFHPRHKKPWCYSDELYLIDRYTLDGPEDVSMVLGRTIGVIMTRAHKLRKQGKMPKANLNSKKHKRIGRK